MRIELLKTLVALVEDIAADRNGGIDQGLVILGIHHDTLFLFELFDVLEAKHLLQVHSQRYLHPELVISMRKCHI